MALEGQYVSQTESERLRASLASLSGEDAEGFFCPGSVTWQVNRESAVFLGAARAALLQLAHPWVAASLVQHSKLMEDAIGRFHSTFRVIYTMLFGTRRQALTASRELYHLHTKIRGELPSAGGAHAQGEHYEANTVSALRWVYATLVESAVLAYNFVLPPLDQHQLAEYYAESKHMAALFGIAAADLPEDWTAFLAYTADMLESPRLAVSAEGLRLSKSILTGAGTWIRPPHWYHALTAYWMPARFRLDFQLPLGTAEQDSVDRARVRLPKLYRHLPPSLRFVGPFHEAQARLRGRRPGPITRLSNRFWMGQPRLLYSEAAEPGNESAL